MPEFNVFDMIRLTEDELGHIEWVVNSPSYERVFKRYMQTMLHSTQMKLLDPDEDRKKRMPDDFLRGYASAILGLIKFLDGVRDNTNQARVEEALAATPDQAYDRLRALGVIRHSGQTPLPEDIARQIAEDF